MGEWSKGKIFSLSTLYFKNFKNLQHKNINFVYEIKGKIKFDKCYLFSDFKINYCGF